MSAASSSAGRPFASPLEGLDEQLRASRNGADAEEPLAHLDLPVVERRGAVNLCRRRVEPRDERVARRARRRPLGLHRPLGREPLVGDPGIGRHRLGDLLDDARHRAAVAGVGAEQARDLGGDHPVGPSRADRVDRLVNALDLARDVRKRAVLLGVARRRKDDVGALRQLRHEEVLDDEDVVCIVVDEV